MVNYFALAAKANVKVKKDLGIILGWSG